MSGICDTLNVRDDVRQSPEWAELQSSLDEAERSAAMYKRIAEDQKQRNRDMRNTVNAVTGASANSRWHELFGTPERAALTLFAMCHGMRDCGFCPIGGSCTSCDGAETIREWLRGDADA